MKWGPRKPRQPMKVVECGAGRWDECDHCLDYPMPIETTDFRVTGTGHKRIEHLFQNGCAECGRRFTPYDEKQPEQRIAMWLCQHAESFVMFDTKERSTVIGLERDDDAEAFRREFVSDVG